MNKGILEKILEYASMPVHGTLSRKTRKDVKLQINEGKIYENAIFFLGDEFIRITEQNKNEAINTYYGWDKIECIRTHSKSE
ncbi:MAG: hypothetical protein ACWGOX_11330 [Desulforhopalus sp.]